MNKKELESEIKDLILELHEDLTIQDYMTKKGLLKLNYDIYQEPRKKDWMIILQNPGENKLPIPDSEAFKQWMKTKQKTSFKQILGEIKKLFESNYAFSKYSISDDRDYEKYVNEDFFNDFHVTDLVKINAPMGVLDIILKHQKEKWLNILKKEISFVQPKYILTFSKRTWEAIRSMYTLNTLNSLNNPYISNMSKQDNKKLTITKVHGICYQIMGNRYKCNIIPLAFLPGSGQNNPLRNSYSDYLREGLMEAQISSI
jgi:hypothetical protein